MEKFSTLGGDLARMVEVTNKGLYLPPFTKALDRPSFQESDNSLSFVSWKPAL